MAENRFDFLRLVFAGAVFVYHLLVLALLSSEGVRNTFAELAQLSIQGFFVVSGALVYGSLLRSSSLGTYAEKRVRRLYPAYAVIVLVPALFALFKTGALGDVMRYLGANLVFLNFLEPTLPGLFQMHAEPAVNGSLWTLKIEVMFYLVLPLLSWILLKSGRAVALTILAIYVGAEVWRTAFEYLAFKPFEQGEAANTLMLQLARQLPGQMSFFISGIVLWMRREEVKTHWHAAGLLGALLVVTSYWGVFEPVRAAGLALLIGAVAYAPGPKLNTAKYGDVSYGVYITHFPIIQALVAAGLFQFNPIIGAITALLLVTLSSFILWRVIERPLLRRDSHYRRTEASAD